LKRWTNKTRTSQKIFNNVTFFIFSSNFYFFRDLDVALSDKTGLIDDMSYKSDNDLSPTKGIEE